MLLTGADFGIPHQTWETAKNEARSVMIQRAKIRGMISYSDLVQKIEAVRFDAFDKRLFHLLGEISSEEDRAGRGMLTVLVVHKTGDMEPGPGFYELAKLLGRKTNDPLKFWVSELHKVHEFWSRKQN